MRREHLENLAHFSESLKIPTFDRLGVDYGFCGIDSTCQFIGPKQVHGRDIIDAAMCQTDVRPEADGVFTEDHSKSIGVVTADCLPVLLIDHEKTLIMAVHAGWRGQVHGILKSALEIYQQKNIALEKIAVAFGPCISGPAYEVGPEVVEEFRQSKAKIHEDQLELCLEKGHGDRWFLDIALTAAFQMQNCGLPAENLSIVRSCTSQSDLLWHSYRRDQQAAGRNISWIQKK